MTDIQADHMQADHMQADHAAAGAGPAQPGARHAATDRYAPAGVLWGDADPDGFPPPLKCPAQPDMHRPTPVPPVGERSEPTEIIDVVTAAVDYTPPAEPPPAGDGAARCRNCPAA